jgi:alkylation response protein AidB-like acyl-CoA dehydrogenase
LGAIVRLGFRSISIKDYVRIQQTVLGCNVELALSETQQLIRATTRKLLEERCPIARVRELVEDPVGFDPGVWSQGGDLGWYAMLVPEEYGGASVFGSGLVEAAIISEELGRMVHPGPFQVTNVVAAAIAEFGSDDQRQQYLPSIASGETVATWAYLESNGEWNPGGLSLSVVPVGSGYLLNGTKTCVQDAGSADLLLVAGRASEGPAQFLVPASTPGVSIQRLECVDLARRLFEVTFRDVRVDVTAALGPVGGANQAIEWQLQVALVLQCAETNGATEQGLALTVQYSKDRVAFGRPIGSYQALKHRMAEHRMWLEASFATTSYASHSVLGRREDAPVAVRIAKAHVGKRNTAILHDCIQLHGGIGMTWDYDLHLYFRRTIGNEVLYGSPYEMTRSLVEIVEGAA